jgi:autotransporter translocation and assembly factor TamB
VELLVLLEQLALMGQLVIREQQVQVVLELQALLDHRVIPVLAELVELQASTVLQVLLGQQVHKVSPVLALQVQLDPKVQPV